MRTLIFILTLLLIPQPARAIPDIPLDVSKLDISFERGSHNSVIASAQDSQGYIWLASIRGLHVYDGRAFRPVLNEVLQGNNIRDIRIDANDVLWVGTNSGVLAYPLATKTPRWYQMAKTPAGFPATSANIIYQDQKGSLWAGTGNGGLHRYEPSFDKFERIDIIPPDPDTPWTVFDIAENAQRDMWLGTGQGVLRLTGTKGLATAIPLSTGESYSAKKITFDGAGNLWVGVAGKGLWILPAQASQNELVAVDELKTARILDLYTDSNGDVWIATAQGLFRYGFRQGSIFHHPFRIPGSQGKTPRSIASFMETKAGTLWIGTYNHGVLHRPPYPGAKLLELRIKGQSEPVQNADIICATSPDSRVYVGLKQGGVYRSAPLDVNQISLSNSIEIEPFLDAPRVNALVWSTDNSLLCGAKNALLRVTPNGEAEHKQLVFNDPDPSLSTHSVRHIALMDDGRIWVSNTKELYSWKPGDTDVRKELTFPPQAGGASVMRSGAELWVAYGSTLHKIDPRSGHQRMYALPEPANTEEAMSVKSLLMTRSEELIVGTTKELLRYNLRSGTATPVHTIGNEHIPNVLSLWADKDGGTWMHTQTKIYHLPPGSNQAREMAIGARHPASSITASPAVLDKMLVYGHSDGLLLVDPQQLFSRPPTLPKISEIRIYERKVPATPLGRMPKALELDHLQNFLSFSFSMPEISALDAPRFVYKLEGVDSAWTDAGTQSSVSYAHLQPGRYVFHLKDGFDGPVTESVSITIHPPWWLTVWAKTSYALFLALTFLISSLLLARLQTARIRKDMLENLVMQDPLTGVPNRRKFQEVLAAEKSRCKRSNHQISVLMIDIDYFKGFNDRFGHQAGDLALRSVAQTLNATLKRPEDFVGRYGGEEFVVVLPSTNRSGAERVAQKIQQALFLTNIPYPGSPLSDRITVSLGISTFSPQTDLHIDSGLFSADQALYQAKRNGRNCFFYKDHCLALTPLRQ
ncbi:ligand-binding sensor domain-containing diguanylate cyclase [Desulfomicrobium baculatum]|uniref:diguanylate cyclase n=1 Tax=Desulfomicrobium baculatum (strain DSM 4028 / VKM B-1378 / X) TaxID=525897 RepID=C7LSS7_DESBD|nr:diguanylate cyclase [Desulfomicrobium baculatum]ACU90677.1 diguanylate cyclase with beta propeller sensor [Desulfomicrobium baculatum DSM 4028]